MIPPTELRIGSSVRLRAGSSVSRIVALLPEGARLEEDPGRLAAYEDLEGIPLTPGWLAAHGFAADAFGFTGTHFSLNRYEELYLLRLPAGTGFGRPLHYVHELENLAFVLGGSPAVW